MMVRLKIRSLIGAPIIVDSSRSTDRKTLVSKIELASNRISFIVAKLQIPTEHTASRG